MAVLVGSEVETGSVSTLSDLGSEPYNCRRALTSKSLLPFQLTPFNLIASLNHTPPSSQSTKAPLFGTKNSFGREGLEGTGRIEGGEGGRKERREEMGRGGVEV